MADILVSYTRADQGTVRRIVALLEAQGWSVWWDTRISGGERWDAVIESEITAAQCVVVVWTPHSLDREWVRLEAHHGRRRGVLVPILSASTSHLGVQPDPGTRSRWMERCIPDIRSNSVPDRRKAEAGRGFPALITAATTPGFAGTPYIPAAGEAEREWLAHDLDKCDDPGLLKAYAAK